jgi:hypothetical protein
MGLRLFLYLVVVIPALSQLELDLPIVYAFVMATTWGSGLA